MDRLRCSLCRNPIKPHHATAGPASGEGVYHEDCWLQAERPPVADKVEQQLDYQRSIASGGLAALLSPYVSVLSSQREISGTSEPVAV